MAFPRQTLLFTETVPHNAYETVEGNPITYSLKVMAGVKGLCQRQTRQKLYPPKSIPGGIKIYCRCIYFSGIHILMELGLNQVH